eukprot:Hpha_TRINITY_DN5416_c0_g1::TRINITY_DN5416_c0_g1_i1::g.192451::m.192451
MEALWTIGRMIRGNRLQSITLEGGDSEYDSESDAQSTAASQHVLSLVYSKGSASARKALLSPRSRGRRVGLFKRKRNATDAWVVPIAPSAYLSSHQTESTLSVLPFDVVQGALHWLTEWDLLRALGVSREWRSLLLADEASNRAFWQEEVLRYQKEANIMTSSSHAHAHFFGISPPCVLESSAFCLLRLKKLHEVGQRRRFYKSVLRGEKEPEEGPGRCCTTVFRVLLLDALHGKDLGILIPCGIVLQCALVMVWVSFNPPCPVLLWLLPLLIASVAWLMTSIADAVLLLGRSCCRSLRYLDSRLWQTRWVTLSRHPTLNRWALVLLSPLWAAFLVLLGHRVGNPDGVSYAICFIPIHSAMGLSFLLLLLELYMQRGLYFELDAGYRFVEPDVLNEAEWQQTETWKVLVWPRTLVVISGAGFLTLLQHRLQPFKGWEDHKVPWSLSFLPLYFCLGFVFAHLYRHPRFSNRTRKNHAPYIWVFLCVLLWLMFLGVDLDVTDNFRMSYSEILFPLWVVSIPLWAAIIAPLTPYCAD